MKPNDKIRFFQSSPFFQDLATETYQTLADSSSIRSHPQGSHVFTLGEPAQELFIIASGLVTFQYCSEDGRLLTLGIAEPKMIVGDMELVDPTPRKSNAVALKNSATLHIDRDIFLKICRENPALYERLLKIYSRRLQQVAKLMLLKDDKKILCHVLINLSKRFYNPEEIHQSVFIDISQTELASFVGIPRQRLNKMISEFKSLGMLSTNYGKLEITDLPALEDHLNL